MREVYQQTLWEQNGNKMGTTRGESMRKCDAHVIVGGTNGWPALDIVWLEVQSRHVMFQE